MRLKYGPYSPSRIETAECPYSFYRSYVKKDAGKERSMPANRGSVVHEMFEIITKGWIENKPLGEKDVKGYLSKLLGKYHVTTPEIQKTIFESVRCYLKNPPAGIEDIVGTEEKLAVRRVSSSESGEVFEECDWEDSDCFARGTIDILQIKDDVATIIDHKTQLYIPSNLGTFQMGVYAWLVLQFYPFVKEVRTILHFCDHTRDLYTKPFTWTKRDLAIIKNDLMLHIDTIENIEDFEQTNPGTHCNYCDVRRECPILLKQLENKGNIKKGPIISAKQAYERASTLHTLEVNKGVLQSELKDFTGEIGSVIIPGVEYGYKISNGWEVPLENKKELFDRLAGLGVDVWSFVNFDIKGLTKTLWKHLDREEMEEIKKLLRPVKKTRFGGRKA